MKLEKINTGNERQIRDYVSSLKRKYSNTQSKRSQKGFDKWVSELKKSKEYKELEKLHKQNQELENKLNDLRESIQDAYGISLSLSSYCNRNKISIIEDYDYDYSNGRAEKNTGSRCSYEKEAELNKAILEKDVAKANKLISELEKKVGVE